MVDEKEVWPLIGMTLDEAADALRVNTKTLRMLIKEGDFPARKVGKGFRVDPAAVKEWLAKPRPAQEMEEDE